MAYDYCVGSTAEDAAKNGLDTTIIMDATRSVMEDSKNAMKGRLDAVGVKEIASADLWKGISLKILKWVNLI